MRNVFSSTVISGPQALGRTFLIDTEKYGGDRISVHSKWTLSVPVLKQIVAADLNLPNNSIHIVNHGFGHGLSAVLSTAGTLPGGLTAGTYYIIRIDADNFKLATSQANVINGIAVDITDQGLGIHTLTPSAAALAGAAISLYESNDGVSYLKNDDFDESITAAGESLWKTQLHTRYVQVVFAITAGQLNINSSICIKG